MTGVDLSLLVGLALVVGSVLVTLWAAWELVLSRRARRADAERDAYVAQVLRELEQRVAAKRLRMEARRED